MLGVQKTLQDDCCRDLVDDFFATGSAKAGGIEDLVRGLRGEALVPKVQRKAGMFGQFFGEALILFGLRA